MCSITSNACGIVLCRELLSWREASSRCHSYGGYLPRWKTSQLMLSHKDEVTVNTFSNMNFEPAEVSFIGMVSNVSMKNRRNISSRTVNIKPALWNHTNGRALSNV